MNLNDLKNIFGLREKSFVPNVGIGTTSPAQNLQIGSNLDTGGSSNPVTLSLGGSYSSTPGANPKLQIWILIPRGTTALRPTAVNGMIRYNTNLSKFEAVENGGWVQFTVSSDARLKRDVENVTSGLAMAEKMRPVFYNWNFSNPKAQGYDDKHQVGFIAQELEQVLPEVVKTGADTYRTVEYGKIVAVAISAIQELSAKSKGTERMCVATESQLAQLEARVRQNESAVAREIASIKTQAEQEKAAKDKEIANLKAKDEAKSQKINKLEQENAAIKARLKQQDKDMATIKKKLGL